MSPAQRVVENQSTECATIKNSEEPFFVGISVKQKTLKCGSSRISVTALYGYIGSEDRIFSSEGTLHLGIHKPV